MGTCADFLTEGQDPKTVEKLMGNVTALLAAGEEIEYVAVQQKPLFNAFPDCVAVTQRRVIFCRLRNFGLNMEFKTHLWEDVAAMQFVENTTGANLIVRTAKVTEIMGYLPHAQAIRLHDFAKEKEAEHAGHRVAKSQEQVTWVTKRDAKTSYELSPSKPDGSNSEKLLKVDKQRKAPRNRPLQRGGFDQRGNAGFPAY
jgi:hypothetical protein